MSSVHDIETEPLQPLQLYSVTRIDDPTAQGRTAIGVEVVGGIDRAAAGSLRNQLLTLAKEHPASIDVDLRHAVLRDPACPSVLVEVWRFCEAHGIEMAVRSSEPVLRTVFELTPSGHILALHS
jgi:anti-anti-sigma regulatory factor